MLEQRRGRRASIKATSGTAGADWKERGTMRFIPELVHNLASAFALRAPMMMAWDKG